MASQTSTSSPLMTLLFAIDFIEKRQKFKLNFNSKMSSINNKPKNLKISKNINNFKSFQGLNNVNRSLHFIGQPQWRGYSHQLINKKYINNIIQI